jgi:hypothetical protein
MGGGIYHTSGSSVLTGVTFLSNLAENGGGGIHNVSGNPSLTNVTFNGNTANYGGGMSSRGGRPSLTNVTFNGNLAAADWGSVGGGGMLNYESSPSLANVLFSGNRAHAGGGMCNWEGSSPTLTNVTFSGNSADLAGGIYNLNSDPTIRNSILWANQAISGSQIYNEVSTPTLAYSDIQDSGGSSPGWDGSLGTDLGNNLDADPVFRDPVDAALAPTTTGDLHLRWGSPAIDAGHNDLIPPGLTTDLDGNPRIVNGIVDMGPYESQSRSAIYLPLLFKNSQP